MKDPKTAELHKGHREPYSSQHEERDDVDYAANKIRARRDVIGQIGDGGVIIRVLCTQGWAVISSEIGVAGADLLIHRSVVGDREGSRRFTPYVVDFDPQS